MLTIPPPDKRTEELRTAALLAVLDAALRWHSRTKKNSAPRVKALKEACKKAKELGFWAYPQKWQKTNGGTNP